jgi:hypothetical protein
VRPPPGDDGPRREILLALCGAGWILFNFPMLILWDRDTTVLGLPLLPVALFAIWAGLIAVLAWASERGGKAGQGEPAPEVRSGATDLSGTREPSARE